MKRRVATLHPAPAAMRALDERSSHEAGHLRSGVLVFGPFVVL
jgi:hypothetical protein